MPGAGDALGKDESLSEVVMFSQEKCSEVRSVLRDANSFVPSTMPRVLPRLPTGAGLSKTPLSKTGGAGPGPTGDRCVLLGRLASSDLLLIFRAVERTGSPRGYVSRADVAVDAPERARDVRDD